MGKRGGWFNAVRKVLSPESKDKKDSQKNHKSKRWFESQKSQDPVTAPPPPPPEETNEVSPNEVSLNEVTPLVPSPPLPEPVLPIEEPKLSYEVTDNDTARHAHSLALATAAAAAQAAMAAAQAAAEVIRLTSTPRYSGKTREELAAIKIQTAYRGYLARRSLKVLRGLVRLKALISGQSVKRQTESTLKCMQNLARLQSQIYARRIRISEENQALQRQLQQKQEKELGKSRSGENWDLSGKSKQQTEAKLQHRQEAALRREKALAYAYSRQKSRKNSPKASNQTAIDTNSPHWGWSWLERWMAARPWETRSSINEQDFNEQQPQSPSSKTVMTHTLSSPRSSNTKPTAPVPRRITRPPQSQTTSSPRSMKTTKPPAAAGSSNAQSERYRRHSMPGSPMKDEEKLDKSQKPKVRSVSASTEKKVGGVQTAVNSTTPVAVKKKPLVSNSGVRRHSVSGKIESGAAAVKTGAGKKER